MTITEKSAYLKGLLEGLKVDEQTKEGKLLTAIIDLINDISLEVSDLEEQTAAINDELDGIEESLDAFDEELDEIDGDLDDIYEILDECDACPERYDDDDSDDDDEYYEVVCPTCGEKIVLDEDLMAEGGMKCPACGEELEFDYSDIIDDGESDSDKKC